MAQQLWLLRHGDAEPHGARHDADRRLTAKGEKQARTGAFVTGLVGDSDAVDGDEYDDVVRAPGVLAAA